MAWVSTPGRPGLRARHGCRSGAPGRHNPSALLYAPLRTVIVEGADGVTRLSMDQLSAQFRSLGDPRITEVGIELDRKVAALLRHLAVPVPDVLTGD